MIDRIRRQLSTSDACTCTTTLGDHTLRVDASTCPGQGTLATEPACRRTIITTLSATDLDTIVVQAGGQSHHYDTTTTTVLTTIADTATRLQSLDPILADRLLIEPITAGTDAITRAGPIAEITNRTGLASAIADIPDIDTLLTPAVGPTLAGIRITPSPPPDAELRTHRTPTPYTKVRIYDTPDTALPLYHLEPPSVSLSQADCRLLADAHALLAKGTARGGCHAPAEAINRTTQTPDTDPTHLTHILRKHTHGYGILEDFFADDTVTDVFAPAPVHRTGLRVTANDTRMQTNTHFTTDGAAALASTLRRTSGNQFSRATPTLEADLALDGSDTTVRATGVTDPASQGYGFAFRAQDQTPWTLIRLIANDTLTPWAAALLSIATERGAAILIAGARGAGKTTLLSALLWELSESTRIITIEDTPELPIDTLHQHDRDVQALHTDADQFTPATALRTALRMGEGALVIGEIRGTEATVLYEAMRVGANASAVLGTIHGDGATGVRNRVVTDLEVPPSSYATTDLIVTLTQDPETGTHNLNAVEEITGPADSDAAPLLDQNGPTGRIDRGSSTLLTRLTRPTESYETLRDTINHRSTVFEELARDDLTSPEALTQATNRHQQTA